ncbi:peroxide stress protein YaaA [Corynebacterium sp. H128]|uniref:peroxide stress protein YaaA n=1 Tax=unclassified Corynebacterium TaxID=2624378 RepID=UPI0030B013E7
MLIVLPPSETKAWGGDGPALDVDKLSFPELNTVRRDLLRILSHMTDAQAMKNLGLSEKQLAEAVANRELLSSPTMPAILRYTGVLYDALCAESLPPSALDKLAVGSALFGLVRANDMIPHYRLSGGSKLPRSTKTMKARWGTRITTALSAEKGLIVDLRSGTYQQLGPVKDAVTVRVEKDGKVVSHFNKHYRGLVARELVLAEPSHSVEQVIAVLEAAGMSVERRSHWELCLIV